MTVIAWLAACAAAPPPEPWPDGVAAAHALLVQLEPDLEPADVSAVCDADRCRVRAPLAAPVPEDGLRAELEALAAPGAVSDVRVYAGEPALAEFTLARR